MSEKPICHSCNEEISGRILNALDQKWHPEHFICEDCKQPIESNTFNEKDGHPYCHQCYLNNHTTKCFACKEPIVGAAVKAMNESWHEKCFVCENCKQPFSKNSYRENDEKAYCAACHTELFAPKCSDCTQPIEGKSVLAMEQKWHPNCFKCSKCGNPITGTSFILIEDKQVCDNCKP